MVGRVILVSGTNNAMPLNGNTDLVSLEWLMGEEYTFEPFPFNSPCKQIPFGGILFLSYVLYLVMREGVGVVL